MNKFLEIIYMNQIMDEDWEKCEENFAKFRNRLKEIVSHEVFEELDELLTVILSILVYTLFSRMFDLMQPPVVKHSIAVA